MGGAYPQLKDERNILVGGRGEWGGAGAYRRTEERDWLGVSVVGYRRLHEVEHTVVWLKAVSGIAIFKSFEWG